MYIGVEPINDIFRVWSSPGFLWTYHTSRGVADTLRSLLTGPCCFPCRLEEAIICERLEFSQDKGSVRVGLLDKFTDLTAK
jgi:hypothetical protein